MSRRPSIATSTPASASTPTRPWWRRPAAGWAAALVVLRITGIVLVRHRVFLDAVRRVDKRLLNPAMLHVAGRRHW